MIWKEVEAKYGKEIADKMAKSNWLQGITLVARRKSDGLPAEHKDYLSGDFEFDYYEDDLDRAYRDVMGQKISVTEWD
jgi:hypothetical protein